MVKYAKFDQDGFPLEFYDPVLWGEDLPSGAVAISDEDWLLLVERPMAYRWDGRKVVEYTPPPPPPYVPDIISRRQFYQQLALQEVITKQEALAAISNGAVPQAVATVIDQIEDDDEKFNAKMLLIGAQTFELLHPLSDTVKQIAGWTDEQRDQFWLDASKI